MVNDIQEGEITGMIQLLPGEKLSSSLMNLHPDVLSRDPPCASPLDKGELVKRIWLSLSDEPDQGNSVTSLTPFNAQNAKQVWQDKEKLHAWG
ncbi:hypothetical protein Plhal304r1_c027g0089991 [Plasmopara halstedii]